MKRYEVRFDLKIFQVGKPDILLNTGHYVMEKNSEAAISKIKAELFIDYDYKVSEDTTVLRKQKNYTLFKAYNFTAEEA